MFKLQHPSDLISRMFILEYIREIGPTKLYEKVNKHQKNNFFYKFESYDGSEDVDINWEFCLFKATLHQLEKFLENFEEEIMIIEEKRIKIFEKEKVRQDNVEDKKEILDINLRDIALLDSNNKSKKLIGLDGELLN